jgi:hypothetical protein
VWVDRLPRLQHRAEIRLSLTNVPSRCVAIVPLATHIEPECERGLLELEKRGVTVWRRQCHAAIDLGRSQLASEAHAAGFDEQMWIDSDIGFSADDVDRLRAHDASFVCAIYPKRGLAELACHAKPGTTEILFGELGGHAEMLYVGMGFCLIRRAVFDGVKEHEALPTCKTGTGVAFDPYFLPMTVAREDGTHWYLSEDYAFCERARRAGHPVIADTRIRLQHVGRYGYSWEDAIGDRQRYANVKMRLR